jgi:hypothetical protein
MAKPELHSGSLGLDENLNKKVNPFLSDDGFYKCSGFHLDEALSISKWKGFQKFNTVQLLESGTPATFTGIFEYIKADQTRKQLATTTKGVYYFDGAIGGAWSPLNLSYVGGTRTGTANDLFDSSTLNDVFYLGNGVDSNLKYTGTVLYNMGITGPSAAQTVSFAANTGAAGVLTGTYQYKVTFYNSSTGHESNPSDDNTVPRSVSVALTSQQGSLVGIPVSSDPQVNKRRIYRTTANGGIWLYLDVINDNLTTTYTDNIPDTSLGVALDTFGNGVPPVFAFIEIWKGFAFMVPKNSSRVYFSKSGFPNAVDSNDYRDLDVGDGSVITGMKRIHDTLVIYKNNSIWNGVGDDRTTFGFIRQIPDVGGVGNYGIVPAPGKNTHYFTSSDGFHAYNGVSEGIVALGVQKDFQALNQGRLNVISGKPYKTRKLLLWVASSGLLSQNDTLFWYDYVQDKWGTRGLTNVKANIIATMLDNASREQFYIGGYTGYVWQGDVGGSDDGQPITCEVIDRAHPKNDNDSENVKSFYHLFLWFNPVPGSTVNVSYAIDNPEGTYVSLGTLDTSLPSGQQHVHMIALGRRIYFKFTESSMTQGIILRGWKLYYKNLGRHHAP